MRVDRKGEAVPVPTVVGKRFPAGVRLTRRAEFDHVFRRPRRRLRNGPLRLVAVRNRMCVPRLGVVASRRVLRRATDRNRAKRHVRESFRHARGRLPNYDIVIVVAGHGDGRPIEMAQLRRAADALWEKLCERP